MALSFNPSSFACVTTQKQLDWWVDKALAAKSITLDTETTGLDVFKDTLVGASIAFEDGETIKSCYIPCDHHEGKQLSTDTVVAALRVLSTHKSIIFSNALFDMLILDRYGVHFKDPHDTVLMSYVLTGNLHRKHGMDEAASRLLGYEPIHFGEVVNAKMGMKDFRDVSLSQATLYAAEDTAVTHMLAKVLQTLLRKEGMWELYNRIDRPLLPVVFEMKRTGVLIDPKRCDELTAMWEPKLDELREEINRVAGRKVNPNSPNDLRKFIYEELADVPQWWKDWHEGTADKDALKDIEDIPVIKLIQRFKGLSKLVSTYTKALPGKIQPHSNRVHCNFNMNGTDTGRFSSSQPNLQNIPSRSDEGAELRAVFIAPPGRKLIGCDYSQIEYRILAHVTQDEFLLHAFRNGIDLHAMMAAQVHGGDPDIWERYVNDKKLKRERTKFKNVNFAVIYGAGYRKIARMCEISEAEALDTLAAHEEMAPGVYDWKELALEKAKRDRFVETIFGRRIHLPYIHSRDKARKGHAERLAINAIIQGSAADLMRLAMRQVRDEVRQCAPDARTLMTVHDELIVECSEDVADPLAKLIRKTMEEAAEGWIDWSIPITAEPAIGNNWREAK
jgi:DNA polymerase I